MQKKMLLIGRTVDEKHTSALLYLLYNKYVCI